MNILRSLIQFPGFVFGFVTGLPRSAHRALGRAATAFADRLLRDFDLRLRDELRSSILVSGF